MRGPRRSWGLVADYVEAVEEFIDVLLLTSITIPPHVKVELRDKIRERGAELIDWINSSAECEEP